MEYDTLAVARYMAEFYPQYRPHVIQKSLNTMVARSPETPWPFQNKNQFCEKDMFFKNMLGPAYQNHLEHYDTTGFVHHDTLVTFFFFEIFDGGNNAGIRFHPKPTGGTTGDYAVNLFENVINMIHTKVLWEHLMTPEYCQNDQTSPLDSILHDLSTKKQFISPPSAE